MVNICKWDKIDILWFYSEPKSLLNLQVWKVSGFDKNLTYI